MNRGVGSGVVNEDHVVGFSRVHLSRLCRIIANREYIASCVCVSGFVPSWLYVSVLRSSVWVVSLEMRRPSKILARVSLRYIPL